MSENIEYVTRQMVNLWGDAVGQLNQKVIDIEIKKDKLPELELEFHNTTKMHNIPDDAEVYLIFRDRLRKQRFYAGTKGALQTPQDIDLKTNELIIFGENYGEAKWQIKFIDRETKFTYAWTISEVLISRGRDVLSSNGEPLLQIRIDNNNILEPYESWGLDFEGINPTILINENNADLKTTFFDINNLGTILLMPEILSGVIDKMIQEYFEDVISENDDSWKGRWLRWCYQKTTMRLPTNIPDSNEDFQLFFDFKSDVVQSIKREIKQVDKISNIFQGSDNNE